MSTTTRSCPHWCQARHADLDVVDHVRLVDAVHNKPAEGSVAVEIEQAASDGDPHIVLSVFTQKKPKAMSAGLTLDQARHAHTVLGEALRLAGDTAR